MVQNVTEKKTWTGGITLVDGAFIGASKLGTEMALSQIPFVGNGTFRSAAVKAGSALGLSYLVPNSNPSLKKSSQIVATGMLIDGMEDLVLNLKKMFSGQKSSQRQSREQVAV